MHNSNLTAHAALRNLRGKVSAELRTKVKPSTTQTKNLLTLPDHYLVIGSDTVIGPDTEKNSPSNNELNIPAAIHR
jgi:hypothetical protein